MSFCILKIKRHFLLVKTVKIRDPRATQSELVQDFQKFVGPCPVQGVEIFLGPVRSQISKYFLSWSWPNRSVRDQPVLVRESLVEMVGI